MLRLRKQNAEHDRVSVGIPKNSYGLDLGPITLQQLETGFRVQISENNAGTNHQEFVKRVVRFVNENPHLEINPNGIAYRGSEGARAFINYLNGEEVPKEIFIPCAHYYYEDAVNDESRIAEQW